MNDCSVRLISGKVLHLNHPDPAVFDLRTIAVPLSRICRFGGHSGHWYSVAEHCVHCVSVAKHYGWHQYLREVLMHDAAEAIIGDLVRPVKEMVSDHEVLELRIHKAIRTRFGLSDNIECRGVVRAVDNAVLRAELEHFWPLEQWDGVQSNLNGAVVFTPEGWDVEDARLEFVELAAALQLRE